MSNINDDVEISISQLGLAPRQLSREGFTFTCPSLSEHLEEIVKEKKFTDVKIVVGEDEFDCHLLVLRSYSEYIDQIAKNDWIDSQIIQLPDSHVSSTAFEMIYDWILAESTRIVERINFVEVSLLWELNKSYNLTIILDLQSCKISKNRSTRQSVHVYHR